ncbi:hypothetical protein AGABI1DRAFT_104403 [Agaricus bisporus var. burnettii JB137-S8]|uniref:Uncharacterized protein n=1 Tax=Agaricus bisporus var. burnettii (strain JB137-S8 / ATCC MYA-4627 / FGSC 10392) TaxID=597362 RepID=K5Y399_AGABU|nr:uncharacterized protein AGABI1DRAFT_104403 [Agaricus bisporus var. burnettii JB137-S8]EKM82405.1 hypothetical protein AGABI1DRAFT_104403 [Agaricus bisporus var. burnettii JB137-S8]
MHKGPVRSEEYLSHQHVGHKVANYIARSPTLHRRSSRSPSSSPEPEEPFDLYIARVVHASTVPDIVAYTALSLLTSISQAPQCKVPHDERKSKYGLSSPSKSSPTSSGAVARTTFPRIIKPHWDERHFFMGAFYLAIMAYKPVFDEEHHKELSYQSMIGVSGIEEEEIEDVSNAFKQCMNHEHETAVNSMLRDEFVIHVSEVNGPYACGRQIRWPNVEDGNENEKSEKKRFGFKRSISSFWKSRA